ncbi:Bug family tripartite tricarboxylate transporter substrate binding protein [Cupriavidus sp. 30B13]|uniref:Bug family tripartite tricarboxylate transporter substrate binding protein n=1 Tax=Cupriavidus sp. 30B13 TaxID=3384241 RepID=UPI003B90DC64
MRSPSPFHLARRAAASCKTLAALLLVPLLCGPALAAGDAWPAKPIRILHGFSPAAATHYLAQQIGERITAETGMAVIVEPRPGAGGNIGTDAAAKSPADGYTFYLGTAGTHAINASLYRKLPFDPVKDFAPVTLLADIPNVLIVNNNLPVNSLKDYVELARRKPGTVHFGSSGNGTSMHLAGEQFKRVAGIDIVHVPYRQSSAAVSDLMGGQIESMFHQVPAVYTLIKAGSVKALAVTTRRRVAALPDVPTVAESGYPGFESDTWYALFAPAGTPRPIVERVNHIVTTALKGELGAKLEALGMTPRPSTPEELAAAITRDTAMWRVIVERVGARLD